MNFGAVFQKYGRNRVLGKEVFLLRLLEPTTDHRQAFDFKNFNLYLHSVTFLVRTYCISDIDVKEWQWFNSIHNVGFFHVFPCFMSIWLPQISDTSHLASNIIPAVSNIGSLEDNLIQQPECNLIYSINDRPPWHLCLLLGFQVRNNHFSSKFIWSGHWVYINCVNCLPLLWTSLIVIGLLILPSQLYQIA